MVGTKENQRAFARLLPDYCYHHLNFSAGTVIAARKVARRPEVARCLSARGREGTSYNNVHNDSEVHGTLQNNLKHGLLGGPAAIALAINPTSVGCVQDRRTNGDARRQNSSLIAKLSSSTSLPNYDLELFFIILIKEQSNRAEMQAPPWPVFPLTLSTVSYGQLAGYFFIAEQHD